jgi:uncharacterized lipoprotein YajG
MFRTSATILASLLLIVCASTVHVSPRYKPTGELVVRSGEPRRVSLDVVGPDERLIGFTSDMYHEQILSDRPPRELVESALAEALQNAGFLVVPDAKSTYVVAIEDFSLILANAFGSDITARVSISVSLQSDGEVTGRVFSKSSTIAKPWDGTGQIEATEALSLALSHVAEQAAQDSALRIALEDASSSRQIGAGRSHPEQSPQSASPGAPRGEYYALVIGNNAYRHLPRLETPVADAREVSRTLASLYGFQVTTLTDATRSELVSSLSGLRKTLSDSDNLLIYYAGHGWLDREVDEGYWLPIDARKEDEAQWVANATVTTILRGIRARHILVIADSCYSGTLTRGVKIIKRNPEHYDELAEARSRSVVTSGGLEPVADTGGGGHSVFAAAWINALEENRGTSDTFELFAKVRRDVMLGSHQEPQFGDIRRAGHQGGGFLFTRR